MYPTVNRPIIMVFAVVGALGLVSVVAVDIMLTTQEVELKDALFLVQQANASKTRCFRP